MSDLASIGSRRNAPARLAGLAALLAVWALPALAAAQTPTPAPAHAGHAGHAAQGEGAADEEMEEHGPGPHHHVHLVATGAAVVTFANGASATHGAVGLAAEYVAAPGWLELELGAHLVFNGPETVVPIDLIAKKPFHLATWCHPYVGLGLVVAPHVGGEESGVGVGGTAVGGAHFWLTENFGLVAQASYALLSFHGVEHEVAFDGGVVVGF